jgi:hypothetical protein
VTRFVTRLATAVIGAAGISTAAAAAEGMTFLPRQSTHEELKEMRRYALLAGFVTAIVGTVAAFAAADTGPTAIGPAPDSEGRTSSARYAVFTHSRCSTTRRPTTGASQSSPA